MREITRDRNGMQPVIQPPPPVSKQVTEPWQRGNNSVTANKTAARRRGGCASGTHLAP